MFLVLDCSLDKSTSCVVVCEVHTEGYNVSLPSRRSSQLLWVYGQTFFIHGKETKTSTNPNLRCGDWTIHTIFDGFIRILCHVPFSLSCHQENDSILKLFLQTGQFSFALAIPEKFHVLPKCFLSFSNLIYPLSSKVPKGLKAPGHFVILLSYAL